MTLDPQAQYVLKLIRESGYLEYWQMTPEQARLSHNERAAKLSIPPETLFEVRDARLPGPAGEIPVRSYRPRPAAQRPPTEPSGARSPATDQGK